MSEEQRPELRKVRCGTCGRFLGYEYLERGMMFVYCPNCKQFNEIVTEMYVCPFTEQEIYETLITKRRPAVLALDRNT